MIMHTTMPASEYHAHPAVSKSVLDRIARTPAHARAYLDGQRDDPTPAMLFGAALHCAVLEPGRFATDFAVFEGDKRTKEGKARYEELAARGATIISANDRDTIDDIVASVSNHKTAADLLTTGISESSLFWVDPVSGLECKCRPDWLREDGICVDLKTTEDASPAGFARSVVNYRYHVQAAHYLAGTEASRFIFVVVEKKAPHAVAVYELDADALEIGRSLRARDLAAYASCCEFGVWPGYPNDVQPLSLPRWATGSDE